MEFSPTCDPLAPSGLMAFCGWSLQVYVQSLSEILSYYCGECDIYFLLACTSTGDRGGIVVKVLCYKSEGHWLDPCWCHWNFSLI